ncbi:MAG: hypothetical protein RMX68_021915 [Aulosira sp. ZfuVER01]|nr:hypothetical protein [Aulosira sp. ZfuCHP01]
MARKRGIGQEGEMEKKTPHTPLSPLSFFIHGDAIFSSGLPSAFLTSPYQIKKNEPREIGKTAGFMPR